MSNFCQNCCLTVNQTNFFLHKMQCKPVYEICSICNINLPKFELEDHKLCHLLQQEEEKFLKNNNNLANNIVSNPKNDLIVPNQLKNLHQNYNSFGNFDFNPSPMKIDPKPLIPREYEFKQVKIDPSPLIPRDFEFKQIKINPSPLIPVEYKPKQNKIEPYSSKIPVDFKPTQIKINTDSKIPNEFDPCTFFIDKNQIITQSNPWNKRAVERQEVPIRQLINYNDKINKNEVFEMNPQLNQIEKIDKINLSSDKTKNIFSNQNEKNNAYNSTLMKEEDHINLSNKFQNQKSDNKILNSEMKPYKIMDNRKDNFNLFQNDIGEKDLSLKEKKKDLFFVQKQEKNNMISLFSNQIGEPSDKKNISMKEKTSNLVSINSDKKNSVKNIVNLFNGTILKEDLPDQSILFLIIRDFCKA